MLHRGLRGGTRWDLFPRVPVHSHRIGTYLTHTMEAIKTRFLGPTDTKGARIKAIWSKGSLTIPYPYEMDRQGGHQQAARLLFSRDFSRDFGDNIVFATGHLPDGTCVHVMI
jgi:hypothetical protein